MRVRDLRERAREGGVGEWKGARMREDEGVFGSVCVCVHAMRCDLCVNGTVKSLRSA